MNDTHISGSLYMSICFLVHFVSSFFSSKLSVRGQTIMKSPTFVCVKKEFWKKPMPQECTVS